VHLQSNNSDRSTASIATTSVCDQPQSTAILR
jgi:hypothetical protein